MPFSEFNLKNQDHHLVVRVISDRNPTHMSLLKDLSARISELNDVRSMEIDLSTVDCLGSTDLGDLLMIRNISYKKFGVVPAVTNMNDSVRRAFEISNFNKLFR